MDFAVFIPPFVLTTAFLITSLCALICALFGVYKDFAPAL